MSEQLLDVVGSKVFLLEGIGRLVSWWWSETPEDNAR